MDTKNKPQQSNAGSTGTKHHRMTYYTFSGEESDAVNTVLYDDHAALADMSRTPGNSDLPDKKSPGTALIGADWRTGETVDEPKEFLQSSGGSHNPLKCPRCLGRLYRGRSGARPVLRCSRGSCNYYTFRVDQEPPSVVTVPVEGKAVGTDEQKDIWQYMRDWRNGHAIVEAGAGVGKTFTICRGLAITRRGVPILNVAFNVTINQEMKKRLAELGVHDVHAKTYNGLGAAALSKAFPTIKLREKKLFWTVNQIVGEGAKWDTKLSVMKATQLVKAYLVTPGHNDELLELCKKHRIKLPQADKGKKRILDAVWATIDAGLADTEGCDYDDQVYMPLMLGLPLPKYRMVCVDEAQDTNRMQWALIERIVTSSPDCRVLAVGDPNQACYGFRGADTNAMAYIRERLEAIETAKDRKQEVRVFGLTITQRCPLVSVLAANRIVPSLKPAPDAAIGTIGTKSSGQFQREVRAGQMVMCRTNAPLVSYAIRVMMTGKRVLVRGREVGGNMEGLISYLAPANMRELDTALTQWLAKQREQLNYLTQQQELQAVEDRYHTLRALMEGCDNLPALHSRIENLFKEYDEHHEPKDVIVFSSIHRAKGLEAPVCWVLCPDLIPHPKTEQPWELEQERNLAYIAITRAKYIRSLPLSTGKTYFVDGPVPLIYGSAYILAQKQPRK